jgi:hypothetical protein
MKTASLKTTAKKCSHKPEVHGRAATGEPVPRTAASLAAARLVFERMRQRARVKTTGLARIAVMCSDEI